MPHLFRNDADAADPDAAVARRRMLGSTATIFAAGAALFSDGYANAVISPVNEVLGRLYPDWMDPTKTENRSLLSSMGFAGMVIGMISFGFISDKFGRKPGMFLTTAIIFVFMILMAASSGPTPQVLINCLIAFRFLVGIGIGGEYPCGSTAAAESTENPGVKKTHQQRYFVWATHFIIDMGFPVAWLVPLIILWIFGESHLRIVWRGALALGAIPPLLLLFVRIFMEEPEAYKKNSMKHVRIPYWLIIKRYWGKLLAVSFCWFIYDWITYPFGMYAGTITQGAIGDNPTLVQILGWGCLINAFYCPGAFIGAFLSDWLGPKRCMVFGLVMQAIFGFALSGAYNYFKARTAGFAVFYGIFLCWGEIGPGNNVPLFAAKAIGPTAARAQIYSIAAASGKVGAFIGTYTFPHIIARFPEGSILRENGIFYIGSGLALLSALVAFFFFPAIKPDAMADEDVLFREYLIENGVDVAGMGIDRRAGSPTSEHTFDDKDETKAGVAKVERV
ncbi:glycerophosphoinositol permease [Vanrija albida]|uniref:Glycerophosphoinositol permease n=1 Tax=Vanrija albida TaxID=181172 RepID=A0ABR3Q9B9_9TREE